MSIGIFYATIGLVTILQSGFCFRCYSCNSIDDKNCEFNPVKTTYCKFIATGCVKLINDVIEYRYVDATGKKILVKDWDGKDTNWRAIPYVQRVITRRCGNNYGRYKVDVGCKKMPFLNKDEPDKEIICYCETELCNGTTKSTMMDTLYLLLVIVTNLYISLI